MNSSRLPTAVVTTSAALLLLLSACAQEEPQDGGPAQQTSDAATSAGPEETAAPTPTEGAAESSTSQSPSSSEVEPAPITSAPASPPPSTSRSTPPTTAQPSTTEATGDEECADLTGTEAAQTWGPEVPTFEPGDPRWDWNLDTAMIEGYDPCADLSSIILPIDGGTVSSPYAVMFFHDGEYIGTATAEPLGFLPQIERVDDATLTTTYTYALDGESNAAASGRAVSTFQWDDASESVQHTGEFPPSVQD